MGAEGGAQGGLKMKKGKLGAAGQDEGDKSDEEEEEDGKQLVEDGSSEVPIECAVCLQTCVYPVQLPCKHIFCFLCVKGVTLQSKRCAMCRREIPPDYLYHPDLLSQVQESENSYEDGGQWFYEGRGGWWQYDQRTSVEIEAAMARERRGASCSSPAPFTSLTLSTCFSTGGMTQVGGAGSNGTRQVGPRKVWLASDLMWWRSPKKKMIQMRTMMQGMLKLMMQRIPQCS